MFRSTRWRSEKHRIKAVFKLQFRASQVLQSGVNALILSIIPEDVEKPTTRLEKTAVRDGVCRWENPVYETVKFTRDPKTGKIHERIYYFVISTGLRKANSIGEASINFADYAEAAKPSALSLQIKNSQCDAVLHVSIQRVQENDDRREEEECEESRTKSQDRTLRTYLINGDADESPASNSAEDVSSKAITLRTEFNADCRTSSGSDLTLSSSGSSSGLDTPKDLGLRNNNIHQKPHGLVSCIARTSEPPKPSENTSTSVLDEPPRLNWDWSADSERGLSADELVNGSYDALPRERSQEASDREIERLKAELSALTRQVDVTDLEVQTLRKQIVKESKRGHELSKELVSLKEERDALQTECENLRSFYKRMDEAKLKSSEQLETGDLRTLVEEIRQELNYEKALNANLQLQLKKTQESNAELVLAVQDLDGMLEQKNREVCNVSNNYRLSKNFQELRGNLSKYETDDDEEQKVLEDIVKEHSNIKGRHILEQKIIDLYGEIEIYRRDKDELEMQMEQLALDYEILKQENHDIAYKLEQSQLQDQLKLQYECTSPEAAPNDLETHIESLEIKQQAKSEDLLDSLATIRELESQVIRLEEELDKHSQSFEADLKAVTHDKSEQEQRAIQAEDALQKARIHIESLENELRKQSEDFSDSMTTIKELESHIRCLEEELEKQAQSSEADLKAATQDKVEQEKRTIQAEDALQKTRIHIESLEFELKKQLKDLSDSVATIKELEYHIKRLEEELEKLARSSEADLKAVTQEKVEQEQRAILAEEALQKTRIHIERLEIELKKQSEEFSDSMATINELESHIRRLEEELEKQAESFEADLNAVTQDKVEQEQRAIRAEEALRKTRIKNANAVEKLQEEFKRLSMQMTSTFVANEKAAMKGFTEASELRAENNILKEMLQKVKEEPQSVKAHYEVKLNELSNQIDSMRVKTQQMLLEIEDKSKQLENQKKAEEKVCRDLFEEMRILKAENEKLKVEILRLSEQVEQKKVFRTDLELMKKSPEESETPIQRGIEERDELVDTIALLRKEAEESLDELNKITHLKDEKETLAENLKSELEVLQAQYRGLRHSLFEDEAEKEKLRKQIFELKGDLMKKNNALINIEKKVKDNKGCTPPPDGTRVVPKNTRSSSSPQNAEEMAILREKITTLESLIKSKETALETSTTSFLKKEKELQDKIEELEKRVEEFNQSSALQKVAEVKSIATLNDEYRGVRSAVEHLNGTTNSSEENAVALSSFKSDMNLSKREVRKFTIDKDGSNFCELLTELGSLKQKNKSMEMELKEMQERYLEMSLKFAEVEGERQKLVMTVRSLKSAQKS
ncbi:myosin heavy chain, striated muscle [Neltuma alba]|uniref:myosin heavy chain, striated muscle n=1 Tax=Neltuma alba TaxID=207710 RepID=UPI0010A4AA2C|nr:myosin heavy chain, striated muscle-like [Prosopis alba]